MPDLPIVNSTKNITANIAQPERNEASQPFQDISKVGTAMQNITQKWSDANDVMEFTKAKSNAQIAIANQEALAKNDPNPDNAQAHIKAIQDATTQATEGISNQMVSQKASQEINAEAMISSIKINGMFKEKQMLANDIALSSTADLAAQSKSNAVTAAQAQQIEHDFLTTVQRNYASGLINEGRAKSLIDDYRMGEVKNDIIKEGAIRIGDSNVLTEINKGKDGKYTALSTDQRTEADRMVRLMVRDNHQISIEQNMSNRVDTIKAIANGDVTWQNTTFIKNMATKDPDLAEALQKVLMANTKGANYSAEEDKNADFETLIGNVFKANTKEDINKYLVQSLKPGMSMDRLSIIVNAAEQRGAMLPTTDASTNGKTDPKQEEMDNAVKHIQNFVKASKQKDDNVFVNFFKNLTGGSTPTEAAGKAINTQAVTNRPDLIGNPVTGKTMIDRYGNRAIVYPDGHVEEIKGKSK